MNKYRVCDINGDIFSDDSIIIVEAKTPKAALKKLGYKKISRDYSNSGNIVITRLNYPRRSYLYIAQKEGSK